MNILNDLDRQRLNLIDLKKKKDNKFKKFLTLTLFDTKKQLITSEHAIDTCYQVTDEKRGFCQILTLNRSHALNALTKDMVKSITSHLLRCEEDNDTGGIIIKSQNKKAFCAGGDIKKISQNIIENKIEDSIIFFKIEYQMIYLISILNKPFISFMDGIVMGGGCGLSIHGDFKIVTEKTILAMPECSIGLFPDVGATYFLNRLPEGLRNYIALTGARIKGIENKAIGLATHYVKSDDMEKIQNEIENLNLEKLKDHYILDKLIKKYEVENHYDDMTFQYNRLNIIGELFNGNSLNEIILKISNYDGPYKNEINLALDSILKASPLSLNLTLKIMNETRYLRLDECLEMEYKLLQKVVNHKGDFCEGVRSKLIDKKSEANWKYRLNEVTNDVVNSYFN